MKSFSIRCSCNPPFQQVKGPVTTSLLSSIGISSLFILCLTNKPTQTHKYTQANESACTRASTYANARTHASTQVQKQARTKARVHICACIRAFTHALPLSAYIHRERYMETCAQACTQMQTLQYKSMRARKCSLRSVPTHRHTK
jgi:hypothetical protein